MLQNWLKPKKGHNGPVPALNVILEPGRNRVKKILIFPTLEMKILAIKESQKHLFIHSIN